MLAVNVIAHVAVIGIARITTQHGTDAASSVGDIDGIERRRTVVGPLAAQLGRRRQQLRICTGNGAVDAGADDIDIRIVAGRCRNQRLVASVNPVLRECVLQETDCVINVRGHGNTQSVGFDGLKTTQLNRARKKGEAVMFFPQIGGRILVDTH